MSFYIHWFSSLILLVSWINISYSSWKHPTVTITVGYIPIKSHKCKCMVHHSLLNLSCSIQSLSACMNSCRGNWIFIISMYVVPRRRHKSINRNGARSFFDDKNASMTMVAIALVPSAAAATAKAVVARYKITWKGIGLTWSDGGSSHWYAFSLRDSRLKSMTNPKELIITTFSIKNHDIV